ncbi:MAG: hypothetical protein ABI967_13235 [bacterium]
MSKRPSRILQYLFVALVIPGAAIHGFAQQPSGNKQNTRPESTAPAAVLPALVANVPGMGNAHFTYEFTQPQFVVRHIVIEHDANGRGKITFERLNEDTPIVDDLQISQSALARISALWQALHFLDEDTAYQAERQFPHLGTMRITMAEGERKRTAEFNWTKNADALALVTEYRRVADQANLVFDISVARENQPLNAPKLMELTESLLKRNGLSDPQQLVPLLKEVSTDEHVPLIARNHALRILAKIK